MMNSGGRLYCSTRSCLINQSAMLVCTGVTFVVSDQDQTRLSHNAYIAGPQQFHCVLKPNGIAVLAICDKDPNNITAKITRVIYTIQAAFHQQPLGTPSNRTRFMQTGNISYPGIVPLLPIVSPHLLIYMSRSCVIIIML